MALEQLQTQERIIEAFQRFDVDGDGKISREELAMVLQRLCPTAWSEEDFSNLFQEADKNKDGVISYEEFVCWLFGGLQDNWEDARKAARGWTDFRSAQWVHMSKEPISNFYMRERTNLGEGGFGSVCKAVNKKTLRERAIKTIRKPTGGPKERLAADVATQREKLEVEMALMKMLDHRNVAQLYEAYEDNRNYYLVLELCTGGELFDWIVSQEEICESQVAGVTHQILRGVQYMHMKHVCHRDLKPENFLLSQPGDIDQCIIKIIDFGVSCTFKDTEPLKEVIGTRDYMAPELLRGSYNNLVDIWAAGVVLFMMLTGEAPFPNDDEQELERYILAGAFDTSDEIFDQVSSDAKDLLHRMMEKDAAKRISATDALEHAWIKEEATPGAKVSFSQKYFGNMRSFRTAGKLKKRALHLIARRLNCAEMQELKDTFASIDVNGDGKISFSEMQAVVSEMGITDIREAMNDVMEGADVNWSGEIDYTEFLAAALDKKLYEEESICWAAFHVFDRNGDGKISRREVAQVVHDSDVAEFIGSSAVTAIMQECDTNGDGFIDFEEFMQMMRSDTNGLRRDARVASTSVRRSQREPEPGGAAKSAESASKGASAG